MTVLACKPQRPRASITIRDYKHFVDKLMTSNNRCLPFMSAFKLFQWRSCHLAKDFGHQLTKMQYLKTMKVTQASTAKGLWNSSKCVIYLETCMLSTHGKDTCHMYSCHNPETAECPACLYSRYGPFWSWTIKNMHYGTSQEARVAGNAWSINDIVILRFWAYRESYWEVLFPIQMFWSGLWLKECLLEKCSWSKYFCKTHEPSHSSWSKGKNAHFYFNRPSP